MPDRPAPNSLRLLTEGDALFFLRRRVSQLPLGIFEDLHDPLAPIGSILKCIAKVKQEGWAPDALRAEADRWGEKISLDLEIASRRQIRLEQYLSEITIHRDKLKSRKSALPRTSPRTTAANDPVRARKELIDARVTELTTSAKNIRSALAVVRRRLNVLSREAEKAMRSQDIANLYEIYERELATSGYADFSDLITHATRLIENDAVSSNIKDRKTIREQWRHILIDEFQDINWICGRLLRALDGGRCIIWAVGDPQQSIYRFLGASPRNLAQFVVDYPRTSQHILNNNYRSVASVVRAGRAVWEVPIVLQEAPAIPHNHCGAHEAHGTAVTVLVGDTDETEALALANLAIEHRASGGSLSNIAILCRTRGQADALAEVIEDKGVATTWSGELFEREGFRDLMCVLLFACGDVRGLERLTSLPEYSLSQSDRILLLGRASDKGEDGYRLGLRWALRAARKGQISGLSDAGIESAYALHSLMAHLNVHRRKPERKAAWRMIAAYLFKHSEQSRDLLRQRLHSLQSGATECLPLALHRRVASYAQTAALARSFAGRVHLFDGDSVRAFIDYVTTAVEHDCLETPDEIAVPGEAVHILTIHQSKGLEWPVVFVPNLAQGRFPFRAMPGLPLPPSLLNPDVSAQTPDGVGENDAVVDEHAVEIEDERCLFYVAITRAQNRLVLSRAEKYHGFQVEESAFLEGLLKSPLVSGHFVTQRITYQEIITPSSERANEATRYQVEEESDDRAESIRTIDG